MKKVWKYVIGIGVALVILLVIFSITFVETNHTAVKVAFGQVNEKVLNEGLNFKAPFFESIKKINHKKQTRQFYDKELLTCASSEKVKVTINTVTIVYSIDKKQGVYLVKNFDLGNYNDVITIDIVESATKIATQYFTGEEVTNKKILQPKIIEELQLAVNKRYGENVVEIIDCTVKDIDRDQSYNDAIAAKNKLIEDEKAKEIQNRTAIAKAQADRKVKEETALGEANAMKIRAQGEKDANELKEKSITNDILAYEWLQKWDGKLPIVSSGDGSYMLDVNSLMNYSKNSGKDSK